MIDDAMLPAAAHLTGDHAAAVLAPAVAATGATLIDCRPVHVKYRPGNDLVVRYRAEVAERSGATRSHTLLAGTTAAGAPAGTLPVQAELPDGTALEVGVWTWPFDPTLPALAEVVVPARITQLLADVTPGPLRVEVIAYRPTERAVMRVTGPSGPLYVKTVPPRTAGSLIDVHERLSAAGLPVPRVLAADADAGWLAISECAGPTLRDLLKSGCDALPTAGDIRRLLGGLATTDLPAANPRRSRVDDAPAHAAMLATVMPAARDQLHRLVESIQHSPLDRTRCSTTHGDLHEAQLVAGGGRVSGLLDLDDVGAGDPLEDVATLLGHLQYRAATASEHAELVESYARSLRRDFAADHDPVELDLATAAVLVGLATSPFRVQQGGWEAATATVLDRALHLADTTTCGTNVR